MATTAMQGLIEWCLENAYYETPFGEDAYLVIEFDSLRSKFDELKELEKQQIINAHHAGYMNDGIESAEEYFNQEYNNGTN